MTRVLRFVNLFLLGLLLGAFCSHYLDEFQRREQEAMRVRLERETKKNRVHVLGQLIQIIELEK